MRFNSDYNNDSFHSCVCQSPCQASYVASQNPEPGWGRAADVLLAFILQKGELRFRETQGHRL